MSLAPESEIERITERKRSADQCAVLRMLGIAFGVTLSGKPIVAQSVIDEWAGAKKSPAGPSATLNTDAIRAGKLRA